MAGDAEVRAVADGSIGQGQKCCRGQICGQRSSLTSTSHHDIVAGMLLTDR